MAYTRQYTEGVGWENEPSINTPISAENLNQMDNAILNIDAAVAAAFADVSGGRIFSDYVKSVSSYNELVTSTNIYSGDTQKAGDVVILYMDVNATYDSSLSTDTWGIVYGSLSFGLIADYRDASHVGQTFTEYIAKGSTLIIVCNRNTRLWELRAIIPAADGSGGGCGYDAAVIGDDATSVTVYSSGETPIALTIDGFTQTSNATAMVRMGKLTTLDYDVPLQPHTDGLFFNINSIGAIPVYYNNTKVTGDSVFTFDKQALYILLLRNVASQQEPWRFDIVGISNSSGGASTLAALTDTNISTPSDGQFLKYDATSAKWINASGGGGGASTLADLTDTTITSPTAAQPLTYDATNSKWINGGVIPAANGGTGNTAGYIRTGRKANTTIGTGATIEGYNNEASASYTHAEGTNNKATANGAHAEGMSTEATSSSAHAEGNGSKATGTASHAENTSNTASGNNSHAGGNSSTAGGTYSFAHGRDISIGTNGQYAAGFGQGTVANYSHQFVAGKYNHNKSGDIFEVGIGTGNNARANGLELDTSGNLKTAGTVTDSSGAPLAPSSALAPVENGATASQAYASGEHFMRNGKFCTATTAIASGDTLTVGTNYSEGNVAGSLGGGGGSSTLAGLTDTAITTPTNGQVLTYDAANNKWINAASGSGVAASVIGPEETGATASQAYVVGNHFIRNDKFCTVIAAISSGGTLTLNTNYVEGDVASLLNYLEQTVTLSTSADTTVTFSDAKITTSSCIEVGTSVWGIVPSDVTVTTGVCTVTLPKADSAQSIIVRIYVR